MTALKTVKRLPNPLTQDPLPMLKKFIGLLTAVFAEKQQHPLNNVIFGCF